MKANLLLAGVFCAFVVVVPFAHAQYKAPSQYFRKDSPPLDGRNSSPAARPAAPSAPAGNQFKDLPVNSAFFFVSDTNRTYQWTKVSATTAKNAKNGITQTIPAATVIQR